MFKKFESYSRVATVMEKSWNFWNFMEFRLKLTKVMEKSWKFEIRTKSHGN